MQSASGGLPQDRNGVLTVVELNSPRVAPLHRFLFVHCLNPRFTLWFIYLFDSVWFLYELKKT
ncbi:MULTISPECIES: hypothetical protein [unclassified Moorena]|uniref:hypothetical protein n=1 Tax=unclassified Moorena TaxID=2683338 RepID=UPI001417DB32|nr:MULTISPECIES: hypothetical protein [unclassified Moorena]NEO13807.1 hypothetical protein [Moorena sp. SIO3E8]